MVTSDFRPEVEIRPFRACAMKNMQYTGNPYLWPNRQNYRVIKKIGVEKHDCDLITGSGNMAVSRMRNASDHNYWNSSFITTWLWGIYHVPQNAFLVIKTSCYRMSMASLDHINSQALVPRYS